MSNSIAIIGMACTYPGAHSPEELWQNVLAGRRLFRKMPPERLPISDYFDADPSVPGKTYCDKMAVITDWKFDPVKFRVPPITVEASDIAHWLSLDTANRAFLDAGLNLKTEDRSTVGIVLGNSLTGEFSRSHSLRFRWPYVERAIRNAINKGQLGSAQLDRLINQIKNNYEGPLPEITEDSLAGNMSNTIAGRVCNHFDLGGGGYTIDGACSSSLLAIVHACNALLDNDLDTVIAGGVDVSLDPFEIVGFAKTNALAKEDIRPYDQRANGMITGEGCGLFVLAREEDARAKGHTIHALIKGWGYSSDGAGGITEPIVEGQMRALKRAYKKAGYAMSTVGLIEGHGTGTPVGDKVEISAIQQIIAETPHSEDCRIGSIKANIGHCKAAAGAAGVIKAVMSLKRKVLPPTVNCQQPNLIFKQNDGNVCPNIEGKPWKSKNNPRRAAVSSMGFGGSNSHITLEEADPDTQVLQSDLDILGSHQTSELMLLTADTIEALKPQIDHLIPIANRICRAELTDLSAALIKNLEQGKLRIAIVAESPWQLASILEEITKKFEETNDISTLNNPGDGIFAAITQENPTFVALFPGQGSQRLNMGTHNSSRYPFVRELCQAADDKLKNLIPSQLSSFISRELSTADTLQSKEWESALKDTHIAQPAIVLSSLTTLKVLEYFGLCPTISMGHSLGEISALHAAGACDAESAIYMAGLRGQAMASLNIEDPGGMVAISMPAEQVEDLIKPFNQALVVSNYNSPQQTVVSGTSSAIADLLQLCTDSNIRCRQLPVSHAFHSTIVSPSAQTFNETLNNISLAPLTGVAISTSTGKQLAHDTDLRELLSEHICRPVRFTDAISQAAELNPTLWIEVGPGGALTGLVRDTLGINNAECYSTDLAGDDGFHLLNIILARTFVAGFPVVIERLFADRFHRLFPLHDYNPGFIVNPCERPVDGNVETVDIIDSTLPSSMLPSGIDEIKMTGYLASRGEFLREFIALDYAHVMGKELSTSPANNKAVEESPLPKVEKVETEPEDETTALNFAVDWIAKRTGFPVDTISPDMRLRDDLNLDSIKAGELVVVLSQKIGVASLADPSAMANETISILVEKLLESKQLSTDDSEAKNQSNLSSVTVNPLTEWVRSFSMEFVKAPLDQETPESDQEQGSAVIVADSECQRAQAIAVALGAKDIKVIIANADTLLRKGKPPSDLAILVVVLPENNERFIECSPNEFNSRIEDFAKLLFRLFRWARQNQHQNLADFRAIVLRPVAEDIDKSIDLDCGAAFMKSLNLENPDAHLKWISIPQQWSAQQWAVHVLEELNRWQICGRFNYTQDGQRHREVAIPAMSQQGTTVNLEQNDVFLVSGGAKGITFELTIALAKQTDIKVGLLGSSPMPDSNADLDNNEMLRNFKRLEQEDIPYLYVQCDVTDRDAVLSASKEVENKLGKVTGILHGAGVTTFALLQEKKLDDFLHCIRIKAQGLYNLLVAVPPKQLKALHAISSILGHTGMRYQTDYTFANAWLDGAITSIAVQYPHIHCLSVGYSVWDEIGIGAKHETLDSLRTIGVLPIPVKKGVAAYLELLENNQANTAYVVGSSLSTDLEKNLYHYPVKPKGRFLEIIQRWVPGVDIIADAVLSHKTDLYLPEHVFDGTPMFLAVMAIEAMIEAAQACTGRCDLPILRNIQFNRPLVVPADAQVIMRTYAVAELSESNTVNVHVIIQSEQDGFKNSHFEAHCLFGSDAQNENELPVCPQLPKALDLNPEDLSPVPLFQGKLLRRISSILKMDFKKESITLIDVPEGEQYYSSDFNQTPIVVSPAIHDAFLQAGAIILPPGSLPESIGEIIFHQLVKRGAKIVCYVDIFESSENQFLGNIAIFNTDGKVLETWENVSLQKSSTELVPKNNQLSALSIDQLLSGLESILESVPHSLCFVDHKELKNLSELSELSEHEVKSNCELSSNPRQLSTLANQVASRRAVCDYVREYGNTTIAPNQIIINHDSEGKPKLQFEDDSVLSVVEGIDITLSDLTGFSVALVGSVPIGIDLERVEIRNAETWRGLLGDDGYTLALNISAEINEPFDYAATRVWTLLEAGKKINSLTRMLPDFESSLDGSWLSFKVMVDGKQLDYFCSIIEPSSEQSALTVFTVVLELGQSCENPICSMNNGELENSDLINIQALHAKHSIEAMQHTGPQGQRVFEHYFPLSFQNESNLDRSVYFSNYAQWMGKVRELALDSINIPLAAQLETGQWGLVTNYSTIQILSVVGHSDCMKVRFWIDQLSRTDNSTIDMTFEWFRVGHAGDQELSAISTMQVTWVSILEHGVVMAMPLPSYFQDFINQLLPIDSESKSNLTTNSKSLSEISLGQELYIEPDTPNPEILIWEQSFETSLEDANLVGNIYYSNYYIWQGRVRDRAMYQLFPETFLGTGIQGQLRCLKTRVDHLTEAMPFDTIHVRMYLKVLYECGIQLAFEYFKEAKDGTLTKLGTGEQNAAWLLPTENNRLLPKQLPDKIRQGMERVIRGESLQ